MKVRKVVECKNGVRTALNVYLGNLHLILRNIKHIDLIEPRAHVIAYGWGRNRGMKEVEGGNTALVSDPQPRRQTRGK